MTALGLLWRHNRLLLLAFAAALCVTLLFALRAALFALYWNDPAHRDQPIEGWMTPRYVAHSWDVPRAVMVEVLGTDGPPRDGKPQPLRMMADERGVPLDQVIAEIETAIAAFRAAGPASQTRP